MKVTKRSVRHKATERDPMEGMKMYPEEKVYWYTTAEEIERANIEGGEPRYFQQKVIVYSPRKTQSNISTICDETS